MEHPHLHAIVLAGGSGTRFWPASRRARPKQLQPLVPGSERSLIELTIERILELCPPERIVVATGEHLLEATRRVLPQLPPSSFLGEPRARNTAASIAWATAHIARRDPEAMVMVLPSDHHVADLAGFLATLRRAIEVATTGPITTVGIEPTRPDTGFGYIELGETTEPGVRRVVRFVEKPDEARAQEYVASGRYLWNAGMFFFRARVMLDAVRRSLPDLAAGLDRIEQAAAQGPEAEAERTREVFAGLARISIDHGVMEQQDDLRVVPASFGWSDLGSWQSAWELAPRDEHDNTVEEGTVCLDARGNLVRDLTGRRDRAIVLLGVDDLCVVETEDALLVMPRARAQQVRDVVAELRERGSEDKL